jgi:hypothetical protein
MHVGLLAFPGALRPADRYRNWRWRSPDARFLVVRYARKYPLYYEVILNWMAANFPRQRQRFELRTLPLDVRDWTPYVLHIPWIQDPVRSWSVRVFEQANRIADECGRRGIGVVNPVAAKENTTRVQMANLLGRAGVPVPRTVRIDDADRFAADWGGLRLPLFIREECGHRHTFYRVDAPEDLVRIPWRRLAQPVATEIIDARDPRDGIYRKFRYIAAGDWGCLLHVQFSSHWITRGENMIINEQTRAEELAHLEAPDPNHEQLQRARIALGLDFVAFDYGYDSGGRLMVWEANPMPFLHFGSSRIAHRTATMHRIMAALLRLYLTRAGLTVPERVEEILHSRQDSGLLKAVR